MKTLDQYGEVYIWNYIPSLPAAVVFSLLFGLATIVHLWKMVYTRTWFCIPFVVGGIFEEIGFTARACASNSNDALLPYLLQAIFLLLPPVFFAATLYMVYSRVVRAVQGEAFSLISPRWTSRVFIIGDLVTLNIQSTGAGLLSLPDLVLIGDYIVVAGLGLQVLMFAAFVYCCAVFNIRFRAHKDKTRRPKNGSWQSCLNILYATSLLILLRNIYRMAEFIMGNNGYLMQREWPTYVFDATLMLGVMIGFFIWYPHNLRAGSGDIPLTSCNHFSVEL
ncbi:Hypothetical protein R9X50_00513800 [Acrodontium crateriforme]|uniref:RTA1-like protein n=1 Tax=Acrodontium crateriforme TaxID=150365 RepID=A0AAQ3MC94_9PEZI|nr:Hypothetical protein R9X50_00513800 [Acrodontium crateriforme]